jgi:hypothetical protein
MNELLGNPVAVLGGVALFCGLGICLAGLASFAGEKVRGLFTQRAGRS